MVETTPKPAGTGKKSSGWPVLLLSWLLFSVAYFAFSKTMVTPAADISEPRILEIADTFGAFIGVGLGALSFLATGLVYLVVRAFVKKARRSVAFLLTVLGYAPWLVLGYDLVYLEPRYVEVARAIITYAGKPMFYSAAFVCGAGVLGLLASLLAPALKKRNP